MFPGALLAGYSVYAFRRMLRDRAIPTDALRVGAGAAALLGLLAVAMVAGGAALGRVVEFDSTSGRVFRLSIGLLLILFGLRQARLLGIRMRWLDRVAGSAARMTDPARVRNPAGADFAYGFGYLLAGFG